MNREERSMMHFIEKHHFVMQAAQVLCLIAGHYCCLIACLLNDLLCVDWDVKPYTLSHCLIALCKARVVRIGLIHFLAGWCKRHLNRGLVTLRLVVLE